MTYAEAFMKLTNELSLVGSYSSLSAASSLNRGAVKEPLRVSVKSFGGEQEYILINGNHGWLSISKDLSVTVGGIYRSLSIWTSATYNERSFASAIKTPAMLTHIVSRLDVLAMKPTDDMYIAA